MNKILIKFNLIKKEKSEEKNANEFFFWSCVLDTSIEKVDYVHLNRENEYRIKDFKPILLKMEYYEYSEAAVKEITKNYKKRPEYFVASDKTFLTGSPYRDSSSLVETYYQDTFEFVRQLREFCGFDSDYKFNLLQHNVIKLISNLIGIDILKNESTAGALSIYNKLPAFEVCGNYNSERGKRHIIIFTHDDLSGYKNLSVQIEILDDDKVLYNTLQSLCPDFKFELPDLEYLENFSQLRISVFAQKISGSVVSKIYEEKFHLVRSFIIDMSVGGGFSKIVQNRYLDKQIDKIMVYDHIENISKKPKDFFDIEQLYKSLFLGKEKEYLETIYFDNTPDGKKAFMGWVREKLHGASNVKIIDAYFDNYGLNDFSSCCDSLFQLTIVTTDPQKRKKSKDYITNTKDLKNRIYSVFPYSKIYYVPRFHDRYLYIDNNKGQKLFSFSNSWNGTVNHSSIFIQEVPLRTALRIYDEINTYITDQHLQPPPQVATPQKRVSHIGKKYSEKYIETLFYELKLINYDADSNGIIHIISELFSARYYNKIDKGLVRQEVRECLERLPEMKIHDLIDITTERLLAGQKKSFDAESKYVDGKSFSWYDTPRKCLERLSHISMWPDMRSYNLNLDYGLSELLSICFKMYPIYTIRTLLHHEERICIKKASQENADTILEYRVSEYIIQSFLTEFYPINGKMPEQTWKFVEKTDFSYMRIFFALSIINQALLPDRDNILPFDDIIQSFLRLKLPQNEVAVVFGNALNTIILRKQSPAKLQNDYHDSIVNYAAKNFCEQGIIDFSFIAFIEPFEMYINEFIEFIDLLERQEKVHETENVEKLFLLYSLQTNPKLQNKAHSLLKIEQKDMEACFHTKKKDGNEPSDIDIRKFIPSLPYLGSIFAHYLEANLEISEFEKIVFSLSPDMALIFNTKFPAKLTLFYYDLLFLLNTVYYLKNRNSGKKILDFTGWYLPVCIKCLPNDFYGLGLKIVGLYEELMQDEKEKSLLDSLTYLPMKALAASIAKEQSDQTIEIYKKYTEQFNIDGYDKSIPAENFLNIGISLCLRCTDECNSRIKAELLDCIVRINEKIKPSVTEEVKHILDYGIEYAKTSSKEARQAFVDSMKNKFFHRQAKSLLEE